MLLGEVLKPGHPPDSTFTRPSPMLAQYAAPLEGLCRCGAGIHPGGGVMAASSHNAAQRILKDRKRRKRSVSAETR